MSEPDSVPAAQKPSEPAATPAPPPPPANPPPERPKWLHDWLRLLAEPHKIPGRTGAVLLVLFLYAQWQGAFDPLIAAGEAVGGPAAVMLKAVVSPLAAIPLAFWAGFALWAASAWRNEEDRRFVTTFTWVMLAVFVVPLGSVALFGYFLAESKIPEAVRYVESRTTERYLDRATEDRLYVSLRKVAASLPPFTVAAAREPESSQHARDFMRAFYAAGLRLENGSREDAMPVAMDLSTPQTRGINIGVKDPEAPPPPALTLGDALREAGVRFKYMPLKGAPDNYLSLIVAPAEIKAGR